MTIRSRRSVLDGDICQFDSSAFEIVTSDSISTTSYFVLGSYSEKERPRLEAVRDQLASDAATSKSDNEVDAFLMDDILDVSEFFTSKFKLLVSYADQIVGVYEHSQGGHAWEAGYIDQPIYRDQTRAIYRDHETLKVF